MMYQFGAHLTRGVLGKRLTSGSEGETGLWQEEKRLAQGLVEVLRLPLWATVAVS